MAYQLTAAQWGQSLVSLVVTIIILGLLLFVPAGTLNWPNGWLFLGIFVVSIAVSIMYMARVNPEIFAARSRVAKPDTKSWDLLLIAASLGCFAAICIVAGLDDGRFHWSHVPDWLQWLGYLMFFFGFWLTARAQAVNRHFEPSVRVQLDRGHSVIDTGPYAQVRHPGYIGGILLAFGMALGLGSLWAIVPAVVLIAVIAYRTLREEATLKAELPGYTEYTGRVKYRFVPGVW